MANSVQPFRRAIASRRIGALALVLLVLGFVSAILTGSPARANPGAVSQPDSRHCTPPTNPYNDSTTVATCGTTTTVGQATVNLSASYQSGHLKWRACAGAVAAGRSVQLYVGRQGAGSAQPEAVSQITSNGCTPNNNTSLCLAPGSYTATAVVQGYGEASQSFNVQTSGCQDPKTLTASAGQTGGGANGASTDGSGSHHGFLAYTGAHIVLMAIVAGALLTAGYALVRVSRQRRRPA